MYKVTNWDTDEIITSVEKLSTAMRKCRAQGHTGASDDGNYYAPVALVTDADGYGVYNPVFRVGKHDHLKAETFTVVSRESDDDEWQVVDTRGSMAFAEILAKNTAAPMVAVFKTGRLDAKPRFMRDNRDKSDWPIRSGCGLINAQESDSF